MYRGTGVLPVLKDHISAVPNKTPFELAIAQFHASLAPKEQSLFSRCESADDLLSSVRDIELIKKSRDSSRIVRRVKAFNDSLSHSFTVIDILVQSHPEYVALGWGAIRLVLQVFGIDIKTLYICI